MNKTNLTDVEFAKEVNEILNLIADKVEDHDIEGLIDVDLNGDILTLTNDKGVFVINKQSAAKEIWLSSPISGPYHFAKDGKYWQSKNNAELFNILGSELHIKF
ncbi:MAG: iron donor protein CyaY [Rickettsiaceae bacterium]|nr:iron donor protein CyaY [Rickettsiaceae bacterium]